MNLLGWTLEYYMEPTPDCSECCTRKHSLLDISGFTFNNKPKKVKRTIHAWRLEFEHNRRHEKGCYLFVTVLRYKLVLNLRKVIKVYTKEELLEYI